MCQPLQRYIQLFMIQQGLQTMRFDPKIKKPALIYELLKEKCFSGRQPHKGIPYIRPLKNSVLCQFLY